MYYLDRPKTAKTATEKEWRAAEYRKLRSALAMSSKDLAALTGLSFNTVRQMPAIQFNRIPSLLVLERMRAELERQPHVIAWRKYGTDAERIANLAS
jgi:transcriptional regulator with XRE-family HTH domain